MANLSADTDAIIIRLERVTEPRTGIWCDRCLLPSVTAFDMAAFHVDRLLHIGGYSRCESGCDDVMVEGQATGAES